MIPRWPATAVGAKPTKSCLNLELGQTWGRSQWDSHVAARYVRRRNPHVANRQVYCSRSKASTIGRFHVKSYNDCLGHTSAMSVRHICQRHNLWKKIQLYVNTSAKVYPDIENSEARGVDIAKISLLQFAQPPMPRQSRHVVPFLIRYHFLAIQIFQ